MQSRILFILLLGNLLASGCATITKGRSQDFTVDSRPPGASCLLQRDGETVGKIDPTPGTISISKSKHDIQLNCNKEGFLPEVVAVDSEFQGMTVGNAIFGGLIGVAVDSSTGAMNKYPSSVTVMLVPVSFASEQARDQFFDGMRKEVHIVLQPEIDELEEQCGNPKSRKTACRNDLEELYQERDKQLADIEAKQRTAVIGNTEPAAPAAPAGEE